jgi:predicted lipoprotein with Yx(FWY)xxD motif
MSGLAGIAMMAAACGSSGGGYGAAAAPTPTSAVAAPTPTTAAAATTVTTLTAGNSPLGSILVDSKGRSLYLFEADTGTTSTCTTAGCVTEWPPLIANGTPQPGAGLAADQVGTTTRPDGTRQITYSGHPLYYFAGDTQNGNTKGQGLNDNGGLWYVVHTDGTAVTSTY